MRMHQGSSGTLHLLATALGSAVAAGLTVITATVLVVDTLRPAGDPTWDLRFYILLGGTLAGVVLAGVIGWTLLGAISSTYRRGGLAMVCGFATVLLMLVCIPINQVLGRTGLVALLGLCGVSWFLLARRALSMKSRT
jgi:hypothetical protein